MASRELCNVRKPTLQAASSSISVGEGVKECISAVGQEHKGFEGLLQGGDDSGDKTVRLEGLTISMTCFAKIAVGSDKETKSYELKMTSDSDTVGAPLLEWHPKPNEGPINLLKMTRETTPAAIPQNTLANALCDVMHHVKRKMTGVGVQETKENKKAKKSSPHRAAGSK
ncbi:uncharacterized protein [Aegilops tauschii subsp. strangulata]|nr:uncharacterized protein LOC123497011 [Aegilops tauschii subsp. strangulata]